MARTGRYGIRDVWLAGDGTLVIARGDRLTVQLADGSDHDVAVAAERIVPSATQPRALIAWDRDLRLLDWGDGVTTTALGNPEGHVLPTAFSGDEIYVGLAVDGIARCRVAPGLPVLGRTDSMWPVRLHQTGSDRLWVMGSSLGAAHYDVFALPDLERVASGDVASGVSLRSADKQALEQAHVGAVVDVSSRDGKTIPLEHVIAYQVPPLCAQPVSLIESSVDADNRIIAAVARYVSGPGWRYPLSHDLDVAPRLNARGRFAVVASGGADTGDWTLLDVDSGAQLGGRRRPLSDIPAVRICGDKLAAAWIDGAIDMVDLPQ